MNPLSQCLFFRRNRRRTLVLTALFMLAAAGVMIFIGLAEGTYIAPAFAVNAYLEKFYLVQADGGGSLPEGLAGRIRLCPHVQSVVHQTNLRIKIPNTGGAYFSFRVFGLDECDLPGVLRTSGVALAAGSLPVAGSNGIALSEEITRALGLTIGDTLDRTAEPKRYLNIERPLRLTGILSGDVRLGVLSREFMLDSLGSGRNVTDGLLVVPRHGRTREAQAFLNTAVRSPGVKIYTDRTRAQDVRRDQELLYLLAIPVVLLLAAGMALALGAASRLDFVRRLDETAILLAVGKEAVWIARRQTLQLGLPALAGSLVGIALSWLALAAYSASFAVAQGFPLDPLSLTGLPFVMTLPVCATAYVHLKTRRALDRCDPVAMIEGGEAGLPRRRHRLRNRRARSNARPLSAALYNARHPIDVVLACALIALLTVATALVTFVFSAGSDALRPEINNLGKVSAIAPASGPLNEELVARVAGNPDVARLIPAFDFSAVKISIPPMFPDHPVMTLCVDRADMVYLTALYDLRVGEGRLPRASSNEIVLPWIAARNRGIRVGDPIGDPERPAYPSASALPVTLTVSGIFAPAQTPAQETWLSFLSLEFVRPWQQGEISLIVVPTPGRKTAVDAWLREATSGTDTLLYTQKDQARELDREMSSLLFTFSVLEAVVAVVAILILAGFFHTRLLHRKAEFGVFLALGRGPGKLVSCVARETAAAAVFAWIAGMVVCLGLLVCLQYGVYQPAGLSLRALNPLPWLFTLPLPVAAVLTSAGAASRILVPLDPVLLIERH